jgi:RNA polymerase sigma factor (sigma-70 family)
MTPQELFDENHKLIWKVIAGLRGHHRISEDDLHQELAIVFWRCCQLFKPEKKIKFSTYSMVSMKRFARQIVFENTTIIRPSKKMGWEGFNDLEKREISLDDERFVEPAKEMKEPDSSEEYAYEWFLRCLDNLDPVKKDMLSSYFNGEKQSEIAKRYGKSRENTRQWVNRAFFKAFGITRKDFLSRFPSGLVRFKRGYQGQALVKNKRKPRKAS